jgi:L-galactose dehydrogenase/L-glyceraldehyde 3-phosphate reductase
MEYRQLGRTGLKVSALGFGCGAVGGLLVRGEYAEMVQAVARAVEAGVTYFDTARIYGDGLSETNLGLVLAELKPEVVVGTKVRLTAADMARIEPAVSESVEGSLKRLKREQVDLIQLHNPVGSERQAERGWVGVADVAAVIEVFEKLQGQGKVRYWGINGLGDTAALQQAVISGRADTVQCCFNLLNPTAGVATPSGFPYQDYRQLIDTAAAQAMGVIAIRVLAAGALSGSPARHPNAAQNVEPISSGQDLAEDVARSQAFQFLVQEGYATTLVEAAIRFALSKAEVSTALVGLSNLAQLEAALQAANKGPLAREALDRLPAVWAASA